MSILTTFALMATAVIAKIRQIEDDPRDVTIRRLEAEINDLKRERDDWRTMAENWRAHAYERADIRREQQQAAAMPLPQIVPIEAAMEYVNQQLQATVAQQAQRASGLAQQGQNLLSSFEGFCNCVPARHDLFLSG